MGSEPHLVRCSSGGREPARVDIDAVHRIVLWDIADHIGTQCSAGEIGAKSTIDRIVADVAEQRVIAVVAE